ncbi:hypothetical protein KC352_g39314, partial [Hortaea werneckii]
MAEAGRVPSNAIAEEEHGPYDDATGTGHWDRRAALPYQNPPTAEGHGTNRFSFTSTVAKMVEKRAAEHEELPSKRPKVEVGSAIAHAAEAETEQERAVGITAYVSPSKPSFQCVVKQRYTDFLVNEILPSGAVLHLTELPGFEPKRQKDAPVQQADGDGEQSKPAPDAANGSPVDSTNAKEPASAPEQDQGQTTSEQQDSTAEQQPVTAELSSDDRQALVDIFGDEVTDRIVALYSSVLRNPHKRPRDLPTIRSGVISEKSQRTAAHVAIRRIFASKLQTETMQDEAGVIAV